MKPGCLFALLALCFTGATQAQPVYRCGSTFSHVPCSGDTTPVRTDAAPAAPPSAAGDQLCIAQLKARFKDPASVRVGPVTGPTSEVIDYRGGRLVVKSYLVAFSVPDTDGQYVGERRFACQLSEDARRVIALRPATDTTSIAEPAAAPGGIGSLGGAGSTRRDRPSGATAGR